MITVSLSPTRMISVAFSHPNYNISPHGYSEPFERPSTQVIIYDGVVHKRGDLQSLPVLGRGIIKQYFKDRPWSKERRCKEALRRALDETSLSRVDRAKVWAAFHARSKKLTVPPSPATTSEVISFPSPTSLIKAIGLISERVM